MGRYITDAALTAELELVEDWGWEDAQLDDTDTAAEEYWANGGWDE